MYRSREMVEMEGGAASNQPQQITDMFQKFAIAFKTKTYELFAEETADGDDDVTLLLDSAEDFIPDQKVVVIKPDSCPSPRNSVADVIQPLVPSLFATLSSFEASYLQFQAAHVLKIDQSALELADKSIVSIFEKFNEMKNLYRDSKRKGAGGSCEFEFPARSFLEFQVQENQSKLRALETMVNSLQSQIDVKDDEVRALRNQLNEIRVLNTSLSRKLGLKDGKMGTGLEVLLTTRVFEAMLSDSVKSCRCFTKLLIDLMRKAGWDLEDAASSVYSEVNYAKEGHYRYAFLSYVCLGMFQNFDKSDFGVCDSGTMSDVIETKHNQNVTIDTDRNGYLRQLIDHVAINPMESLTKNPKCEFARFCEMKYDELIHPTMESSIFINLDRKEKILNSWKSLTVFYESFIKMASSVWLLHKLAYSFNPTVEIFQVERGVGFSMVYMEDVLEKFGSLKTRPKMGFTVVPGFKVGKTVIQSQVYLPKLKSNES